MDDERVVKTLRFMAWQRAKGELNAYLDTFWPSYGRNGQKIDNGFEDAKSRIDAFIKDFEGSL